MGVETGGPQGPLSQNSHSIKYGYKDTGPFVVILESINQNIGNLHPIVIGRKFKEHGIKNVLRIKKKGKNRVAVDFITANEANTILESQILKELDVKAYIPISMVTCKGIARGIHTSVDSKEFVDEAESLIKIIEARRIKKRSKNAEGQEEMVDTEDMVITFRGTTLPKYIKIHLFETKIQLYIPQPMQCKNCLRYGHSGNQCRGKKRCFKCGDEHEPDTCKNEISCIFCKTDHMATSKTCDEYIRQKNIKRLMAVNNISYFEARKLMPKYPNANDTTINRTADAHSYHPTDFPKLPTRENLTINVSQRRTLSQPAPQNRESYSVTTLKKRKNDSPISPVLDGYNKAEHQECLFPNTGRTSASKLDFFKVEPIPLMNYINNLIDKTNLNEEAKCLVNDEIRKVLGYSPMDTNKTGDHPMDSNSSTGAGGDPPSPASEY